MASCPKCGKPRLRKDALNRRRCPRCGILRGPTNMDTSGTVICVPADETEHSKREDAA